MRRWLFVTNEEEFEKIQKTSKWYFISYWKPVLKKMAVTDIFLVYIKSKGIVAEYKVIDKPILCEKRYYFSIKELNKSKNPIDLKKLSTKLTFIKDENKWGNYLQRALKEMTEEDYKLIKRCFND